jgi:PAS domain S-box-containing protein
VTDRYETYFRLASEGIWCVAFDEPIAVDTPEEALVTALFARGVLRECNDAMARMYGYAAAAELVGARLSDMLPADDPGNREIVRDFIRGGYRSLDRESHERDRDGHERWFLNNFVGVVEGGRLVEAWGTQRDITERKQLEAQLRHAQKMEAVGGLAGGVAHDFNNLLTVVLSAVNLARRRLGPDARILDDLSAVEDAARRGAHLTRQLLTFSRRTTTRPVMVDLNRLIGDVIHLLEMVVGDGVEITVDAGEELGAVWADANQLEQVIVNLVLNARDAMPDGGRLVVETRNVDVGADTLGDLPAGRYVMLAVGDTGVGMPAEVQARLFEAFFTTKGTRGTGLGLATSLGIVRDCGGTIRVYSELGLGTTMRIYLPRRDDASSRTSRMITQVPPRSTGESVLLVEDEEALRTVLAAGLETSGFTVRTARSGAEALALVRSRPDERIDVLVTDIAMPGMNGLELSTQLRRVRPDLGIVYMSGYSEALLRGRGLEPRAIVVDKPFSTDALALRIRSVLDAVQG